MHHVYVIHICQTFYSTRNIATYGSFWGKGIAEIPHGHLLFRSLGAVRRPPNRKIHALGARKFHGCLRPASRTKLLEFWNMLLDTSDLTADQLRGLLAELKSSRKEKSHEQ
jgi:hypothetical protein